MDFFRSLPLPGFRTGQQYKIIKYTSFYIFWSFLWILFSDSLVIQIASDPETVQLLSTAKGWLFVIVTGTLLYTMLARNANRIMLSEAAHLALFNYAADSIIITDADGRFQDVNVNAEELLGYSRLELLRMSFADIISPGDLSAAPLSSGELRVGRSVIDRAFIRKDGSTVPVEISATSLPERRHLSIIRDISGRRKMEEALLNSEKQNRAIVNAVPDLLFRLSKDGTLLDYRAPDDSELLMPPELFLGKHMTEVLPPDVSGPAIAALDRALSTNRTETFEYSLSIHGDHRHYEDRIVPLSKDEALSVIRDITSRKRAEEELRRSEQRFRMMADHSPIMIGTTDTKGIPLFFSKSWLEFRGKTLEEEAAGDWLNDLHPEDRPRTAELMKQAITSHTSYTVEYRILNATGEYRWVLMSAAPYYDASDAFQGFIGSAVDVTERKQAEEDRKKFETQLLHAQKVESIGTLAAGIAHDFNNILNIVLGNVSLLATSPDVSEKSRRRIDAITAAAERGGELVKQLLTFARKSELRQEIIPLNDFIRKTSKLIEETFPKTLVLSFEFEPHLAAVTADPNQLYQVLLNLCVNARDAMPSGGKLTIKTRTVRGSEVRNRFPLAAAEEYAALSVIDTGIGMDETTRSRMFDPFFTTKAIGKGTGLGLSVVHGIVQSHGGYIDAHSEPGQGSEFTVYLPTVGQSGEQSTPVNILLPSAAGNGETLLLIEDEELALEAISEYLSVAGFTVLTARDAEEGVAIYENNAEDIVLVLSDYGLPKFNGEEVYRRLRTIKPEVKFVLLTGFLEAEVRERMTKSGVAEIITKPFKMEEFLTRITEMLNR